MMGVKGVGEKNVSFYYIILRLTGPSRSIEQSLRSLLKVAIIPTFRSIVVHLRFFRLKRAKKAFLAGIYLLEMAFLPFSANKLDYKANLTSKM
jgi:hypothetical protein